LYELDFVAVALCVGSLSFANTLVPKTTRDQSLRLDAGNVNLRNQAKVRRVAK
jgi:hypothetical protein